MDNKLYDRDIISSIVKKIKNLIDRGDETFNIEGANNLLDDAASAKTTVLSIIKKVKALMVNEGIEVTTDFPIDECDTKMDRVKAVPPYADHGTITLRNRIGSGSSFTIQTDLYDGRVPTQIMWTFDGTVSGNTAYITDSYYRYEPNLWGGGSNTSFEHYFTQWNSYRATGTGLLTYTFDQTTGKITCTVASSGNNNQQRYIPAGTIHWTVFSRRHNDQNAL